jgi:hypothetical protein
LSNDYNKIYNNGTIGLNVSYSNLIAIGPGFGLVGSGASLTGWILIIFLLIIVIFAMPFVRRKGYFQVKNHLSLFLN